MESRHENQPPISLFKPLRCIVKLGGAAITCKNELEKINEENLAAVSAQLREAFMSGDVIGMDWSKRPGQLDLSVNVDHIGDQSMWDAKNFIVVHGAGSFGHFQASKSGVHKGGLDQFLVKAGFVATRISVTSLNMEIVRALAQAGIPSIGVSPFSCGWTTDKRNVASADISNVAKALDSGFIPVLHGDAVLDHSQGCTILSGDVIIRHMAELLRPQYVVFLTDVFGVYDRPPTEPDAVLLKEIAVDEDGNWRVVNPAPETMHREAHDTTGGMVTKISEAAAIAKLGIDVYIVKAATEHSLKALKGEVQGKIPHDWLGTAIFFMRK
uniref:Isopentenyl phosphate kinase n=1 Tax=Opuntia streptacantha TaxID=393608 RepID=A0A7C9CKI2_OPUST